MTSSYSQMVSLETAFMESAREWGTGRWRSSRGGPGKQDRDSGDQLELAPVGHTESDAKEASRRPVTVGGEVI
jgi:hypothetical protein